MDWRDYTKLNQVGRALGEPVMGFPSSTAAVAETSHAGSTESSTKSSTANNRDTVATLSPGTARSPSKPELYVDHVAQGSRVKPLLRPIFPYSKKNQDTFERQEQRDKQKFVAAGHKYWAQMGKAYHHHHKAAAEAQAVPEDHVYADRGRHKPEWCRNSSIFDPITSTSKPIGSPDKNRVELRPRSAPHVRPGSATGPYPAAQEYIPRRPGTAREVQGRYNPLTHTWIEQPDAAAQAVRQKQSDRIHGRIGIRTGNSPYSPNRGTGAAEILRLDESAAEAASPAGPAAADAGFFAESGPSGSNGASNAAASGNGSKDVNSSGGSGDGGKRRCQSAPRTVRDHGESWGTYDCLHHKWLSPPKNQKYADREAAPNGIRFDSGSGFSHTKKVPMPANQGIYNPITGQWKVLPTNRRAAEGLDFAPTKMFTRQAFTDKP